MTHRMRAGRRKNGPYRSLRDHIPGGIAVHLALLLFVCLVTIEVIGWLFWDSEGKENLEKQVESSVAQQIVSITLLWEDLPDDVQADYIRSLNNPFFRVVVRDDSLEMRRLPDWLKINTEEHLPKVLQRLEGRTIDMGIVDTKKNSVFETGDAADSIPVAWRYWLAIEVATGDGRYLVFAVPPDEDIWNLDSGWSWWGAMTWILVIGFIFWMTRRMTRPLRRFAAAADRLGVDVDAPPLPERGSRELRRATKAFNQMQERLRRFIKDRTQMMAAISHDLRTMLTRLRLRAEFIDDEEQKQKALADLNEMEHMLNATLSFARDDSASEPRTRLDLVPMLETMCNDFADMGKKAQFQGPDRLAIEGRPIALKRAFGNLMENAINYGGSVEVRLTDTSAGVRIDFCDRGPGIPDAEKEEVFAPFYRLESSRNRETGGTGLGLSVTRSIIRSHGGDVVLLDAPEGGLIAQVTLPKIQ